ncbi:hypothetical protein MAR_010209 [Mya arenaria]|uniref:Uncharacterized protein n=1 Tax=Mya arenaria TaxID=6604 RepID=A0ABY7E3V2_MYAAR|nr:hypothetical protein MAR_010209 [Mya arenaria]
MEKQDDVEKGTNHSRELPRVEARGGQATGPRHQRAMEKCSMDMAVAVRSNNILQSINDFMMKQSLPLKAKDIAQGTKLGQSRTSVNRYLYCLEKKGILTVVQAQDAHARMLVPDAPTTITRSTSTSTSTNTTYRLETTMPCTRTHHTRASQTIDSSEPSNKLQWSKTVNL